jgi:hypothetical protein
MPSALRELSQPSGTLAPKLLRGPKLKLKVNKMKALKEIPLFRIKNGKSFQ